jgi:acyl carrier protein
VGPAGQTPFEREIAELLVNVLSLQIAPAAICPTGPIYLEGLGLDEIDLLDIVMEISERYGFQLGSDDGGNWEAFASVRSLAAYIASHRKEPR